MALYLIYSIVVPKIHKTELHNDEAPMSRFMRKPAFYILAKTKGADQLRGNRAPDERLCFRCIGITNPLRPKSETASLYPSSVAVQSGLCLTLSDTSNTGFLATRLQ